MSTDKEMFENEETQTKTKGRPQISRNLVRRLLQADMTPRDIAKRLGHHVKTIRRIRRELIEAGELEAELKGIPDEVAQDFDGECNRAMGMSFYEWLKSKRVSYKPVFSFCRLVWEQVWDRPSLFIVKDRESQLGDQLCQAFLKKFGEDKKRIRRRKKLIRTLFTFLGRQDLNDRHLTMTRSRDPRSIKKMPEITFLNFPATLERVIDELAAKYGENTRTFFRLKIVGQMRTGYTKGRGISHIRIGSGNPSYIIMSNPDEYRLHVIEKQGEDWDITWLPKEIRQALYEIYKTRNEGEKLFKLPIRSLSPDFTEITKKIVGREMELHDLRKVSITWLYIMGVPLEIATILNVGWRDLNTVRDHYLQLRGVMKKSDKLAYRERIPAWFKDGLDEYTEEK